MSCCLNTSKTQSQEREREIVAEILVLVKEALASQDNNLIDSLVKRIVLLCQILILTTRDDKLLVAALEVKVILVNYSTTLLKSSNNVGNEILDTVCDIFDPFGIFK